MAPWRGSRLSWSRLEHACGYTTTKFIIKRISSSRREGSEIWTRLLQAMCNGSWHKEYSVWKDVSWRVGSGQEFRRHWSIVGRVLEQTQIIASSGCIRSRLIPDRNLRFKMRRLRTVGLCSKSTSRSALKEPSCGDLTQPWWWCSPFSATFRLIVFIFFWCVVVSELFLSMICGAINLIQGRTDTSLTWEFLSLPYCLLLPWTWRE